MTRASAKQPPASPRLSASLIVINSGNEVLMVQRSIGSTSFAGAHVFPGGNFDKDQDDSLEMTAIRETFEETGVLLASRGSVDSGRQIEEAALEEARRSIHANKLSFKAFLAENGLTPNLSSLLPFSEWTTPPHIPRRFRTKFFLTFLPYSSALSGASSGSHIHRLPSPDAPDDLHGSSTEVISAQYLHPKDVLQACGRGELGLMPPQMYLLSALAKIMAGEDARSSTSTQREVVSRLAHGVFGRMSITPMPLVGGIGIPEGKSVLTFEGDEARGGGKGRLNRIVYTAKKGSPIPHKPDLQGNLNIFTDMQGANLPSRL